jgi:hypothetical protein
VRESEIRELNLIHSYIDDLDIYCGLVLTFEKKMIL